ncbi:GNAT family N-acetyltransferase [Candidatus Berkiella cookevillensis]|uniref:GNAT family N-acetyltransferase n=2 Tax=Candidatus Berkiella cookevillensis TaxID=437022 RepID=A0AAE3HQA5_9GAMM|nr:GNAT family N-acetyltransferase [Candidatus Berkiella cookevillensis]MCS5708100.1 GNAT family N-acetyltransferase [Candidatus Berkiella cookevillensis]
MSIQMERRNSLTWITRVHEEFTSIKSGKFVMRNTVGEAINMVWEKIDLCSEKFNKEIQNCHEILAQTYTDVELAFAQKFPEKVAQEHFLQSLAPLFADTQNIDWAHIKSQIKTVFVDFFSTTDFAKCSNSHDVCLFVIAKNRATGEPLGLIQFLASADYAPNSIKVCYYGVDAAAHDKGLEQLLMSTIFKILPITKRIFLHTRATNKTAIHRYTSWGFAQCGESQEGWPDFEYIAEKSSLLQEISEMML